MRALYLASFVAIVACGGLRGGSDGASSVQDAGSEASTEGEGLRCSYLDSPDAHFNGTAECPPGLTCYAAFNTKAYPYDRCCPADLSNPDNVAACRE